MSLTLSSTGSYPRIGDSPELQVLRRTIAAADRGERTAADLADAEREMTRRAIEEQMRAGIELLTDGQIRWHDPVSHFPARLEGIEVRGLLRYFDTNFYFRQPALTAKPHRRAPVLVDDYLFATNTLGRLPTAAEQTGCLRLKPVLPGPYTLAKLSLADDDAMRSLDARAAAYAEAVAAEIKDLAAVGAAFIQIDEPAILKHPGDWDIFALAWSRLAALRSGKLKLALYTYFHDAAPLYEKLAALPVDVLGVDFTYSPKLADVVAGSGSPVPLALGFMDGRNTKLEDPAEVARQVERLLPKIAGGTAHLGPSCGLEHLPRNRAEAKLALLAKVRACLTGRAVPKPRDAAGGTS